VFVKINAGTMIVPVNSFGSFSLSGSPWTFISSYGIFFCERNSFASWQSVHIGLVNKMSELFAILPLLC
jgi:hypothetical protein